MSQPRPRHIIIEGLPAVGKSELLALLARFHPRTIRVLPELVKEVVEAERIDLFRDRDRLTAALCCELPRRVDRVRRILADGHTCVEESHLGVHWAYAHALGDRAFIETYRKLEAAQPPPDLYVRLDLPVAESLARQEARGTPAFAVDRMVLTRMLAELTGWHTARHTRLASVDADRPAGAVVADIERLLALDYDMDRPAHADTLGILLLLGRPASGKSEFIDFMFRCPAEERAAHYHLGPLAVVDDFPILWQKFEEDDAWERLGRDRLYSRRSDGNYAVTDDVLWGFLTDRIDAAAQSHLADPASGSRTLLVEFSRGGHDGYGRALAQLSDSILSRAAILYVSVSFEESWRRNLARYDEKRRSGILTHSVPRGEMQRTYGTDDWGRLAPAVSGRLAVRGHRVPYVTMHNEPESTDPRVLASRYQSALDALFAVRATAPEG